MAGPNCGKLEIPLRLIGLLCLIFGSLNILIPYDMANGYGVDMYQDNPEPMSWDLIIRYGAWSFGGLALMSFAPFIIGVGRLGSLALQARVMVAFSLYSIWLMVYGWAWPGRMLGDNLNQTEGGKVGLGATVTVLFLIAVYGCIAAFPHLSMPQKPVVSRHTIPGLMMGGNFFGGSIMFFGFHWWIADLQGGNDLTRHFVMNTCVFVANIMLLCSILVHLVVMSDCQMAIYNMNRVIQWVLFLWIGAMGIQKGMMDAGGWGMRWLLLGGNIGNLIAFLATIPSMLQSDADIFSGNVMHYKESGPPAEGNEVTNVAPTKYISNTKEDAVDTTDMKADP